MAFLSPHDTSKIRTILCELGMFLAVLFASLFTSALAASSQEASMPASCDNTQFQADQQDFERGFQLSLHARREHTEKPEHICGIVTRVLRARKTKSGWHGYFLMHAGDGKNVRIVSNLDEMQAPAWPWVNVGDYVEVQGRYYYDSPKHQGIDWTHHGTSRKWPWPGFVAVSGQKYN